MGFSTGFAVAFALLTFFKARVEFRYAGSAGLSVAYRISWQVISMKASCCLFASIASSVLCFCNISAHLRCVISVKAPETAITDPSSPSSGYEQERTEARISWPRPSLQGLLSSNWNFLGCFVLTISSQCLLTIARFVASMNTSHSIFSNGTTGWPLTSNHSRLQYRICAASAST